MNFTLRRSIHALTLALLAFSLTLCSAANLNAQEQKPETKEEIREEKQDKSEEFRILVLPVTFDREMNNNIADKDQIPRGMDVSNVIVRTLNELGYKNVISMSALKAALTLRSLTQKGVLDQSDQKSLAATVGATHILNAAISNFTISEQNIFKGVRIASVRIDAHYLKADGTSVENAAMPEVFGSLRENQSGVDVLLDSKLFGKGIGKIFQSVFGRGEEWMSTFMGETARRAAVETAEELVEKVLKGATMVKTALPDSGYFIIGAGVGQQVKVGDLYQVSIKMIIEIKQDNTSFKQNAPLFIGKVLSKPYARGSQLVIHQMQPSMIAASMKELFGKKIPKPVQDFLTKLDKFRGDTDEAKSGMEKGLLEFLKYCMGSNNRLKQFDKEISVAIIARRVTPVAPIEPELTQPKPDKEDKKP